MVDNGQRREEVLHRLDPDRDPFDLEGYRPRGESEVALPWETVGKVTVTNASLDTPTP
jgi:hypothetical protein